MTSSGPRDRLREVVLGALLATATMFVFLGGLPLGGARPGSSIRSPKVVRCGRSSS